MRAIKRRYSNKYDIIPACIKYHGRYHHGLDFAPYVDQFTGELIEPIDIRCGKCIGCRLEDSRQWANRCVLESLSYSPDSCWFLTLTIDDDHLSDYIVPSGFATTRADDMSDFMKDLRARWSYTHNVLDGIRFYGASEYGDETMRPHYHILVFGAFLYDLYFYKNNHQGDALYKSDELDKVWKKGFVTVGEFNWNTAAYTARYVMKKVKGRDAGYYNALGIEPEKTRMSRRPGIGKAYLDRNIDSIYKLDEIVLPATSGCKMNVIAPPKYYDKKLKELDEAFYYRLKDQRKRIAELRQQSERQSYGYDPFEQLESKEEAKIHSLEIFHRDT